MYHLQNVRSDDEIVIDLRQLLGVLNKRKWMIILITLTSVLLVGAASTFMSTPLYKAKAVLGTGPSVVKPAVVEQIKNPALLEKVIDKNNLDPKVYNYKTVSSMIEAQVLKDTNLIEITVTSPDPEISSKLANTLSEELLMFYPQIVQEQMNKPLEILNSQLETERKALEEKNNQLLEMEAEPRGVGYLEKELQTCIDQLKGYKLQVNQWEVELNRLEAAKIQAEETVNKTPPTVKVSQLIAGNPPLVVETDQINPAYTTAQGNLNNILIDLTEVKTALQQAPYMVAQMEQELEAVQKGLYNKRLQYDQLKAEVKRAEETYKQVSDKSTATQLAKLISLGEANITIVSPARTPAAPESTNTRINIAIAAILGLMLSVFLAFVIEYFRQ